MTIHPAWALTAVEAAARIAGGELPSQDLVERLPRPHRRAGAFHPGLGVSRPGTRAGAGQSCRRAGQGEQGRRPVARRSRRHQGHHRYGRHADRERQRSVQGPAARATMRRVSRPCGAPALSSSARRSRRSLPRTFRRARAIRSTWNIRRAVLLRAPPPRLRPVWCRWPWEPRPAVPSSGRRHSAAWSASSRHSASFRAPAYLPNRRPWIRSASSAAPWRMWRWQPMRCRVTTRAMPRACRPAVRGFSTPPPRPGRCRRSSLSSRRMPGTMPMP